jgi:5-formyltetrahydrofolate cyclo-ligase
VIFPSSSLTTDKTALRQLVLQRRREVGDPAQAAKRLCDLASPYLSSLLSQHDTPAVAAYWPMRGEINPLPLLSLCEHAGAEPALPVVMGNDQPLLFRRWTTAPGIGPGIGNDLAVGPFGTRQPFPSAPLIDPTILLIPLVAFDRQGQRLGYGGGFYDRTLEQLRKKGPICAIGLAHAVQEVEAVPRGPHDQALDWIFTDSDVFGPFRADMSASVGVSHRGDA